MLAARYRKRGLDTSSRRIVDYLVGHDVGDATVLEIGGGVGEIQIELLKAGAVRATNLELSPGYEGEAARLAAEAGVGGRVDRRMHNIVQDPAAVPAADVVVLHRVMCCYGDYRGLLAAAAEHARRLVIFSYPPYNVLTRAFYICFNLVMRTMGNSFRGFAHPPAAMAAVLEDRGLRRAYKDRAFVWRIQAFQRAESQPG